MPSDEKRVPIPGSERVPRANAHAVGPADPNTQMSVTVVLRPPNQVRNMASPAALDNLGNLPPKERQYQSREAVAADPEDINKVEDFAHEYGLIVVEVAPARSSIVLSGTVAQMSAAFGVTLHNYQSVEGAHRGREGTITVPSELDKIVVAVLGLSNSTQASPKFRRLSAQSGGGVVRPASLAQAKPFTPIEVAHLYNFPTDVNGQGQCIGIIELGGGYKTADLKKYFSELGIHAPRVSAVSVDGAPNHPGEDADGEVMLDIEVAGAIAPGARIVVYFAPNTDQGFLDAITTAVHDTHHKPSVISISWGNPETPPYWTGQAIQAYNQAFQVAASLGVTICAASGDSGSSDGVADGKAHVDFPASSPYVLGCGGTKLESSNNAIQSEVVWNEGPSGATGGGVSVVFESPSWQQHAGVPPLPGGKHGRGVPDVGGDADPNTGYRVRVDGADGVIGGTSAVAPLWAALIALMNQKLGQPVGYLNPLLYTKLGNSNAFHDITQGNNGAYVAGPGWDACTGLGTPNGKKLLDALNAM